MKRSWKAGDLKIFSSVVFLENGSAVFVRQDGMIATTSLTEPKVLVWVQTSQKTTYGLAGAAGSRVVTYGVDADSGYTVDEMSTDDPSRVLWRTPINMQPTSVSTSADRSVVIIGTLRGAFIVLDAGTGKATGQTERDQRLGHTRDRLVTGTRPIRDGGDRQRRGPLHRCCAAGQLPG